VRLFFFLLIFLTIYSGLHLYGFLKARIAFSLGVPTGVPLAIFMGIMVFAPIIVHQLQRLGFESTARFFAHIGYIWMGILFLFFSASLVCDIYRLVMYFSGLILQRDLSTISLSPQQLFSISILLSLIIAGYGFFEANNIRTEYVTIRTPKIPAHIGRLKIVQVSDIHIGLIVGEGRLKRILKQVQSADPDILVSTGDLVDGEIDNLPGLAAMLRQITPRFGKFAITGNHEFYAGLDRALDFTEKAGFTVLRGQGLTASGLVNIAGVDDPAGQSQGLHKGVAEEELLSRLPREKFTILLKHRPQVDKNAVGLFDLQLSGHVHRGQILPFTLISKLSYPHVHGLYDLRHNSHLYVSGGSGTWGPPIRFLSPPEVTVIELVHAS
jgi:predicted MPP superfamily phosphohydrolase